MRWFPVNFATFAAEVSEDTKSRRSTQTSYHAMFQRFKTFLHFGSISVPLTRNNLIISMLDFLRGQMNGFRDIVKESTFRKCLIYKVLRLSRLGSVFVPIRCNKLIVNDLAFSVLANEASKNRQFGKQCKLLIISAEQKYSNFRRKR